MGSLCRLDASAIDLACLSVPLDSRGRTERRNIMNLLILAALAPLGGFYLYALASFQKELRGARRETRPGAKTIPLYFRDGKLTALDAETDSTIESRLSRTATEPQLSETASVTPVHREAPNLERSIQGPY